MITFNLRSTLIDIENKRKFIEDAVKSVEKQISLIAETEKAISVLTLGKEVDGKPVDMGQLADNVIASVGKRLNKADKAVFAFFNVQLNESKTVTKYAMLELAKAKYDRIKKDKESRTQLESKLKTQNDLLATIRGNKTKAETELETILEDLPDNIAGVLHKETSAVCAVFGVKPFVEHADILSRVEDVSFKFERKDGKRVNLTTCKATLEKVANMLDEMKAIKACHSGMSLEQREVQFSGFDKLNKGLKLFNDGELPKPSQVPIQAPKGFYSTEAAHAVPKEPVFNPLASFFKDIEGSLVVNCVSSIDVINELIESENETRGFSMLKAVKEYKKAPQAALIGIIDNFDIILQGYLNVAMQEFVETQSTSQLDRLFTSPTMVNAGQLTPYGRQVKSYVACVLPYVTLKHRGEGVEKVYYFEPVKFNRFSKLGISEKIGFYAFGVRSRVEKDGQTVDARLPALCIRSHFRITKMLRELKRADDKRIKEAHAREWADYRLKYGAEYTRRTLQDEIDALKAALADKALELAKI